MQKVTYMLFALILIAMNVALGFGDVPKFQKNVVLNNVFSGETWERQTLPAPNVADDLISVSLLDSNHACVLSNSGLFTTIDGGNIWTALNLPNNHKKLWAVAMQSVSEIWVVGDSTILLSTNSGVSWNPIISLVPLDNFTDIKIYGKYVYITGTDSKDVATTIVTKDGGVIWTAKPSGTGQHWINLLDSMRAWLYGPKGSLWYSSDAGQHWNNHSLSDTNINITGLTFSGSKGYLTACCLNTGYVLVSNDFGTTWTGSNWPISPIALTQFRGMLFGSITDSSYSNSNIVTSINGDVWMISAHLDSGQVVRSFAVLDTSIVMAVGDNGLLYKYKYVKINHSPMFTLQVITDTTMVANSSYVINNPAIDIDGDKITYSISGASFLSIDQFGMVSGMATLADVGVYYITIKAKDENGGENSVSWTLYVLSPPNHAPTFITKDDTISVIKGDGVTLTLQASDDDGDILTYKILSGPGTVNSSTGAYSWLASDTGTHIVKFQVSDGSATDQIIYTIIVNPRAVSCPVFANNVTLEDTVTRTGAQYSTEAFVALDGTVEYQIMEAPAWITVSKAGIVFGKVTTNPGKYTITIKVTNNICTPIMRSIKLHVTQNNPPMISSAFSDTIAIVDHDYSAKITATDDDGDKISFEVAQGPGFLKIDKSSGALSGRPSVLYAGTITLVSIKAYDPYGGMDIFTFYLHVMNPTGVWESGGIPVEFALGQNYPNPFNPTTQIDFAVPEKSYISLKVYNPLGQTIATLAEGEYGAGNYSVNFDAANLSSGVYFYRLQGSTFTKTGKMILNK